MNKKLLDVKEASERLGLTVGTLYHWVSDKKISYVKIGRKVLFKESQIDEAIERGTENLVEVELVG